jgi:hypothetical protein
MIAVFVNGTQDGAGVGQVNCACVLYGDEGVGHFTHAVDYVYAGIAP